MAGRPLPFTVCYVLTGGADSAYADMTAVSALSVRALHPGTPITVLADAPTAAGLARADSPLRAIAQVRSVPGVPGDAGLGSRWLKTRLRELLAGDALFLDADTVMIRPLDGALAGVRVIGATADYHDDRGAPILRISPWVDQLLAAAGWPRPAAYHNSGVLWLPDTEPVHAFFDRWKRLWAESVRRDRREDQPAFNVAVHEMPAAFTRLPGAYNVPVPAAPRWMARARIYHFWAGLHLNLAHPLTLLEHLVLEYRRTGRLDSAMLRRCRRRNFPWVRPRGVRAAWQVRAWEEVLLSLARWAARRVVGRTALLLAVAGAMATAPLAAQSEEGVAQAERLVHFAESRRSPGDFEHALDLLDPLLFRPEAPAEAWYLAGRAKLGLAELAAVPRWRAHHRPGTSYAQGARRALTEALRRDPGLTPAATLLAELRTRTRGGAGSAADLRAIRGAASAALADTAYWLRRSRSELEWAEPESALAAVARFEAAGGDPALAAAERARALFALGRNEEGAAAWLGGLDLARGTGLAAYRADLAWVAAAGELAEFDALPAGLRRAWAEAFWARRALADFRTLPERLAEHFTRIRQAVERFRLGDDARDFNPAMPYRSEQALVDDRGVVWVRHGAPDEVLETGVDVGGATCGYVSWAYRHGPDEGLSVHFRTTFSLAAYRSFHQFCSGSRDFKLVPGGVWIDHHAGWMAERDPLYAEWVRTRRAGRSLGAARLGHRIVASEAARLEQAVGTDAHPLRFERDLGAVVRAFALGTPGRILLAWAVPSANLDAATPLRLRVAALASGRQPVTLDTTLPSGARRGPGAPAGLAGALELPLDPGAWEVRTLVTGVEPSAGSHGLQRGVRIPDPAGAGPWMSDVVLGTSGSGLRWDLGGGAFPLSPYEELPRRSELWYYVEAGRLPGERRVDLDLAVESEADPGRTHLQASEEVEVLAGHLAATRTIDLSRLRPGAYRISVTLRVEGSPPIRRTQRFVLTD